MSNTLDAADLAVLRAYATELLESSDHTTTALLVVGLCALPDAPAWAREDRDMIAALSASGRALISQLEGDTRAVADRLDQEAENEAVALGDATWQGSATAADVARAEPRVTALRKLVQALRGGGVR